MISHQMVSRTWLLFFLLCSQVFAYPDASDSTALLYGSRADGSVFRLDLKSSGVSKEILTARSIAAPAIGLLRGNSDQFSLLYGDTAIHRQKLTAFDPLPNDDQFLQTSDSAVFIGTDPFESYSSNFYFFQSIGTHHAIFRADLNPLTAYEIAYFDLPGYTASFIDGAIDVTNNYAYALFSNSNTASINFYRWSLSGGSNVDMLPAGSQYRDLVQFVLDNSKDTATFFDDAAGKFVRLSISTGTWIDSSAFTTDTVLDFVVAKNGDLIWSNGASIFRAGYRSATPSTLKSEANVKSIVLDEGNVKPFIDPILSKPITVASGTSIRIPWYFNQIMDYDYDNMSCKVIGSGLKTKQFFSGCSLYVDASNVAAGSQDLFQLIAGDTHGGTDTANITINVIQNSGLNFNLPLSASVPAYGEQRWKIPISHSIQTKMLDVKVRKLSEAASHLPPQTDTTCFTQNEKWIGQVFSPTLGGELSEIILSGGYNGPVMLRIYNGIGINVSPQYQQFFSSMGGGLVKKLAISEYFYLGSGGTYTIALFPLQDSLATYCLDTVTATGGQGYLAESNPTNPGQSMQMQLRVGEYESEFVNLTRNPDTISLGFVAGADWIGMTRTYRVEANDMNSRMVKDISISVSSGSAGSYVAGSDVRVPMWTGYISSSSASVPEAPDWSPEISTDPRTYTFELLDSSLGLLQGLSLDQQGGLHVNVAESMFGNQKFRIQRCYTPNNSPCSNWDTVKVSVSRPPSLIFPKVDSLIVGVNSSIRFNTPDPDSGDHVFHKASATPVLIAASQASTTGTQNRTSALQTFQASKSGPLSLIQLNIGFSATRIPISFYKLTSTSWTSLFDTTQAQLLFTKPVVVPMSSSASTVNLVVPEVYLDSGSKYGVLIGEQMAGASPHPFIIALNSANTSFPGTSYTVTSGSLTPNASEALQMKIFVRGSFGGSSNFATLPIDTMVWNVTPSSSDVGTSRLFAITVSDGTAERSEVLTTKIVSPAISPPILLTLTIPPSVRVNGNPYDRQKYFFMKWAAGSFNASVFRESQFLTAKDSAMLDEQPWLEQDGSLIFSIRSNTYGTANFRMRLCDSIQGNCSAWDTSSINITHAPEYSPKLPSSLFAGTDTTIRTIVKDQDIGDLAKLSVKVQSLKAGDQQTKNSKLFRAKAVGQFFRVSSQGNLGEIRVFAKFTDSYVQYMIGDSASIDDTTSHGNEAILEGYANVTPDTLMWHSIPILGDSLLKTNITYQFSVGYGGSEPHIVDWGIDTTGTSASGSMLEWLDEDTTVTDSLRNHGGQHILYPKYDLMFQLFWKGTSPTWISTASTTNTTSFDGYRDLRLKPSATDTGSWTFLLSVSDGLSGAGGVQNIRVNAPVSIPPPPVLNPSIASIRPQTQGQALLLQATGTDTLTFNKRFTLSIRLKGANLDSSLIMRSTKTIVAPLTEGKYQLSWTLSDSVKTYKTGADSFTVAIPIHTPPRLQTWYMIGFGSKSLPIDSIKEANYVYRWDDMRTNGIEVGAYVPRSGLNQANPGEGFWYFAENADSIRTPVISAMPTTLKIPLIYGGTGWNMISNPWNWSIRLDTLYNYFAWNDSVGGYQPVQILYPFMAAWVNVSSSTTLSLSPQPEFSTAPNSLAKRGLARYESSEDWIVQVSLISGKYSDIWNFFGVNGRIQPEPPAGMGEHVSLAFVGSSQLLASDMRSPSADATWTLQWGADQPRLAELQFDGIQSLQAQGLRAVLVLQDGSVREIPSNGTVPVNLQRGYQQAKLQILDAKSELRMKGGIRELQVVHKSEFSIVQFDVPLNLAGKRGTIERTSVNGKILERKVLSGVQAGTNFVSLKPSTEAGFIRVRVGNETRSISATKIE